MKLLVIIADIFTHTNRFMYENVSVPPKTRAVTIELTPEQVDQIRLRQVEIECGKPKYEEITGVFIQPEEEVKRC